MIGGNEERIPRTDGLAWGGSVQSSTQSGESDDCHSGLPASRKRRRPDLNVVTDFSRTPLRTRVHKPIVVRSQHGQVVHGEALAQRVESDAYSVGRERERAHGGSFVHLKDLTGLRQKEKKEKRSGASRKRTSGSFLKDRGSNPNKSYMSLDSSPENDATWFNTKQGKLAAFLRGGQTVPVTRTNAAVGSRQPPHTETDVPIVLSVPQKPADAHGSDVGFKGALNSQDLVATTRLLPTRRPPRAVSGVHSTAFAKRPPLPTIESGEPLVLSIPKQHRANPRDRITQRSSTGRSSIEHSQWQRPFSSYTVFEDEDEIPAAATRPRSLSDGSRQGILPESPETARPRSKGWWNLMLTPMLSRAGTLMSRKSPVETEVPPIPNFPNMTEGVRKDSGADEKAMLSAISPETPRRIGMATNWSRWSDWERDREHAETIKNDNRNLDDISYTANREPPTVNLARPTGGLAAEYFQACAVDLRSTTSYFECQNHSCAEHLPRLRSIYDLDHTSGKRAREGPSETLRDLELAAAASGEARMRSNSDSTTIENEPAELSPNVREADAAPILKAKPIVAEVLPVAAEGSESDEVGAARTEIKEPPAVQETTGSQTRSAGRPVTRFPDYVAIMPPDRQVTSPNPISPEAQRALNPSSAIPMSNIPSAHAAPLFFNNYTSYPELPPRTNAAPVVLADIESTSVGIHDTETRRQGVEKEDATAPRGGGLWRGRGCVPAGRKQRRWYIVIATILFSTMVAIVVLATQITRRGDHTPVESQWLNLTGFPPIPTGVSTIARPDSVLADSGCAHPSTLWSCAVPKEDQTAIAPNDPDQPNFRFEIRFRNGTVALSGTAPAMNSTSSKNSALTSRQTLTERQNDPFTNDLYIPDPAPPTKAEQIFVGNTTDNITLPFNGENTPFFITMLATDPTLPRSFNTTPVSASRLSTRQAASNSSSDLNSAIPPPLLGANGTAAPANLLPNNPFPSSQPIKLYNRGQATEHYGFYTYYDKSIFLQTTAPLNGSAAADDGGLIPGDQDGGSARMAANMRCTWSQTRFLVRIWTNPGFGAALLPRADGNKSPKHSTQDAPESSATDFNAPGSFPYPVSITLDRHGGDKDKKGVYCYGVDPQTGKIVQAEKSLVQEFRDFGGQVVNPAPSLIQTGNGRDGFDSSAGGIDGGTGGCGCEWRNWIGNGKK